MAIPERLVEFLNKSRQPEPPISSPDEHLHIDSLGMIRLLAFIQEELGVPIEDDEFTLDNFRTLRSIEQLIQSKAMS